MSQVYWSPGMKIADVEKLVIIAALQYTNRDKTRAAYILGVTPPTIRSKIGSYGIDVEQILGRKPQDLEDKPLQVLPPITGKVVT